MESVRWVEKRWTTGRDGKGNRERRHQLLSRIGSGDVELHLKSVLNAGGNRAEGGEGTTAHTDFSIDEKSGRKRGGKSSPLTGNHLKFLKRGLIGTRQFLPQRNDKGKVEETERWSRKLTQ